MTTPNITDAGTPGALHGIGAADGGGLGMLAVTGAGPGTLVMAIAGIVSVVIGGIAMLAGRPLPMANDAHSSLPDLASRADDLR